MSEESLLFKISMFGNTTGTGLCCSCGAGPFKDHDAFEWHISNQCTARLYITDDIKKLVNEQLATARAELKALRDALPDWYLKSLPSAPAQPAAGEQPTQGDDDGEQGTTAAAEVPRVQGERDARGSVHAEPDRRLPPMQGNGPGAAIDKVQSAADPEALTPAPADAQADLAELIRVYSREPGTCSACGNALGASDYCTKCQAHDLRWPDDEVAAALRAYAALRSQVEAMRQAIAFVPDRVIAHPKKGQWYRNRDGDFVCAKRDHESGEMVPLFHVETPAAQLEGKEQQQ